MRPLTQRKTKPAPVRMPACNRQMCAMNILDSMADPAIFGGHFRDLTSWRAWEAFLGALFADLFRACTGRAVAMPGGYQEVFIGVDRRLARRFPRPAPQPDRRREGRRDGDRQRSETEPRHPRLYPRPVCCQNVNAIFG